MRLSSIAPLLAIASLACAVPHNQVPNTTPVNTELIGATIGDGLSLTNGVISANMPEVPTKTSDLVNDSGYVTESVTNALSERVTAVAGSIPTAVSQLTNDSGYVTETITNGVNSRITAVSNAIPTNNNQLINGAGYITSADIPTKTSDLTNDSGFVTKAVTNGVNSRVTTVAQSIPTKTSQLTNDSGYITEADIPTVPTKTSDLTNDSGFVTEAVTNVLNTRVTAVAGSIPTAVSQLTNDSGYAVTNKIRNIFRQPIYGDGDIEAMNIRTDMVKQVAIMYDTYDPSTHDPVLIFQDERTGAYRYLTTTGDWQTTNFANFVMMTFREMDEFNVAELRYPESHIHRGGTYTMAVTADIPTNNTQLINGAGYITDYKESGDGNGWINYNSAVSASEIGVDFYGIAPNQMLGWRSITTGGEYLSTNYAGGMFFRYGENGNKVMYPPKPMTTGFAKTYTLAITDDIPVAVSQLTNDTGFITSADIPTIPTKVSELTNDKYYVTKSVTNTLSVNVRNLDTRVTAVSNAIPTAVSDLANDSGYVTESITNALSARLSGVSMAGDWVRFTDSTDYPRFIGAPNYAETGEGVSIYAGRGGTPTEYPLYTYTQLSNLIVAIASQIVPTSDYDTLEYISTDGAAWANIGRPIYGGRWEMDIMPTQSATYQCVIGCSDASFNNRYYPAFLNSNGKWACGYGFSYNSQTDYAANTRYSISSFLLTTTPIFKVGNVQATMTRSDGSAPTSIPADMYVGARNVAGNSVDLPFKGRIYSIMCYDNNTPILNLQPARQRSTGKVGLHDLIGGGFYPSITSTAFGGPQ